MAEEQEIGKILTYEEAGIGMEFPDYVFVITEELVREYAKLMGEEHPVMTDSKAAKEAGYSDIVAVPTMMNSYAHFVAQINGGGYARPGESFHSRSTFNFLNPVYPGDTITSKMRVTDKWERRAFQYLGFTIESWNQHGEKVAEKFHASVWPSEATQKKTD